MRIADLQSAGHVIMLGMQVQICLRRRSPLEAATFAQQSQELHDGSPPRLRPRSASKHLHLSVSSSETSAEMQDSRGAKSGAARSSEGPSWTLESVLQAALTPDDLRWSMTTKWQQTLLGSILLQPNTSGRCRYRLLAFHLSAMAAFKKRCA